MIYLLVPSIILAILLIYFGNLRGEWNKPNERSAAITFKDFIYKEYYATQKYTTGAGGAQDNQRNDVIDFLKRGSVKHKVAAIVDGDYWDKYRDIIKAEFINNPNVLITSITEITERIDP